MKAERRNIRPVVVVSVIVILISAYALYSTYDAVQREAINDLNRQQLTHARLAARGIETFFGDQFNALQLLATTPEIVDLSSRGERLIDDYYRIQADKIRIVSRIDANGRIQYAAPYDRKYVGGDISGMRHFQELKRTGKPFVSDVATLLRGFRSVTIQVPVLRDGRFDGAVSLAVSFEHLAKVFLENIRLGKTGYAWMISRDGTELYCPVPGHIGQNVSETSKGFPDLLALTRRMTRGEDGVATYTYNRIRDNVTETVVKHAVFLPVHLINTHWTIIVATPEDDIVATMQFFRNRWLVLLLLLLATGLSTGYISFRAWWVVREQESREKAAQALRESEEKYPEHLRECR